VRKGIFHVWAVQTIDEGIEVLIGVQAGQRLDDGTFDAGTVHYLVDERLVALAERMKEFAKPETAKAE
jgi:hypothetical protein